MRTVRGVEGEHRLAAARGRTCTPDLRRSWPRSFFFSITFIAKACPVLRCTTFLTTANAPRPSSLTSS